MADAGKYEIAIRPAGYAVHCYGQISHRAKVVRCSPAVSFGLNCTHTRSCPGGCVHEVLYSLVTAGFQPEHPKTAVSAGVESAVQARMTAEEAELWLGSGCFDEHVPAGWNRSLRDWNRNPDVTPYREGGHTL